MYSKDGYGPHGTGVKMGTGVSAGRARTRPPTLARRSLVYPVHVAP